MLVEYDIDIFNQKMKLSQTHKLFTLTAYMYCLPGFEYNNARKFELNIIEHV
jgi:hypothetical protein